MRSERRLEAFRRSLFRNAPAKAVSLAVAVVVFFFVRTTSLEQRFITVPLELRTAPRYTVTAGLPATATITLRGEGTQIFQLQPGDVVVYVDLTDRKNEGVYRVPVLFEKHGEAAVLDPLEITVEPTEVTATLEQVLTRSIRVVPSISAPPPAGYVLTGTTVEPATIQVTGPRRGVQALQTVMTLPIDLSETRETVELEVRLDFDAKLFRLSGGAQAKVRATIQPEKQPFNVETSR